MAAYLYLLGLVTFFVCAVGWALAKRIDMLEEEVHALRDKSSVDEPPRPRILAPVDRSLKTLNRRAH